MVKKILAPPKKPAEDEEVSCEGQNEAQQIKFTPKRGQS